MSTRNSMCHATAIAAVVALLTGCAASDSHVPGPAAGGNSMQSAGLRAVLPKHRTSFMRHVFPSVPLAYVSDAAGSFVDVFNKTTGMLMGTITNGISTPQGLYVDSARNLWVANAGMGKVTVYPPGMNSPSMTLNDTGSVPIDVTVCPGGKVYVSNFADSTGTGSVSVYPPGAINPILVFRRPNELHGSFLTCDAAGHLFVAYTTNTLVVHGRVFEYMNPPLPGGLSVALLANPGAPGGVKPITTGPNTGNVMICDQTAHTVTEYKLTLGVWGPTPNVIQTGNQANPGSGADDWVDIAVGSPGASSVSTRLLAADATVLNGSSWQLGGLHAFAQSYADPLFTSPFGVAYDPPQSGLGP